MAVGDQVVYVGPEIVFRGLLGTLLETEDAATPRAAAVFPAGRAPASRRCRAARTMSVWSRLRFS